MNLYHYTSSLHFAKIMVDGHLRVSESNISLRAARAGPDVVWLTGSSDPKRQGWGVGRDVRTVDQDGQPIALRALDKTEIRFTVAIPRAEAHHWPQWSRQHGIARATYNALAAAASGSNPEDWWVVQRPIPRGEWRAVERWTGGEWWTVTEWETEPSPEARARWLAYWEQETASGPQVRHGPTGRPLTEPAEGFGAGPP